ncbi:uncharacterized protein LOC129761939 [Toxorhynchites rutilus septentrionalis]|uniref:uncharacterized protein LOC129761939 n=1 Tax=Toxorhynchites rutilus septentrionalis TaxID=329112 RepID=UPI00247A6C76|nr:uncharacterized protein LOC129761939 [Toxorhynchites rutilus septentrionalis]
MAPNLRELTRQEHFYLDTMENLKDFMENFEADRDSEQLEGWKQQAETLYTKFQANRLKIEMCIDVADRSEKDVKDAETTSVVEETNRLARRAFEKDYVRVVSFLKREIKRLQINFPTTSIGSTTSTDHSFSRIKLPEVKLPTFDGCVSEWITFRDTFKSLIDSNPQLSPIDKLSYLVASLSKDARKVIESVEHTAANYTVAWALLEKRFDNKKLIVKTYIDSLFSIEPIKKECYESLMHLVDDFERNLCMIEKLGIPTDGWSVLLAHMICSRLDASTLKQWEIQHKSTEVPKYNDIITFLRTQLTVLQSLTLSKSRSVDPVRFDSNRSQKSKINTVHTTTNTTSSPGSCPFCLKSPHSPFKCESFQKLSVAQRFEQVKKKNLCINCFSSSHLLRNCSSGSCRVCNQKHHTMLHHPSQDRLSTQSKPNTTAVLPTSPSHQIDQSNLSNQPSQPRLSSSTESQLPSTSAQTSLVSTTLVGSSQRMPATVLLQTAIIKVFGSGGDALWARALLDPASQLCLITENMVQKLKLRRYPNRQEIGGVGNTLVVSYHAVDVRIGSRCTKFTVEESCQILKKITRELPVNPVDSSTWNIPSEVILADPKFYAPGPIDLLLGMELYFDLLLEGLIKLGPEKPVLQNTVFGWVASGKIGAHHPRTQHKLAHVCSAESVDDPISRFWEIESCWSNSIRSPDETFCEHFVANTFRDESGRFVVTLPKRPDILSQLGSSEEIATRRFLALERRLDANLPLKEAYTSFVAEYLQLNHMREIDDTDNTFPSYYLPHHGVEKVDSTTTKLRVVFDASCRTDSGFSLNQALIVGPVLQDDILDISLRFRIHQFAIITDAEKMYRQIRLHPDDFPLHQIRWWSSSSEPLKTFELTTVTYGTASTPYLATRCLLELSKQGANEFPLAAKVPSKDFYMNDMLTGVDDEEDGKYLCRQLRSLLQSAGLAVRLLTAKSKVAPLGDSKKQKRICLPRLELSSALLLRHLYHKVQASTTLNVKTIFWTDSMITLHWLRSTPSRWKTFIANRVSEVQNLTQSGIWAHVPGIENPADIISRGMRPAQLQETASWWNGPPWLSQPSRFWPPLIPPTSVELPSEMLEERTVSLPVRVHPPNEIFFLRSSFQALVRLIAFLRRFIHNSKLINRSNRRYGFPQASELAQASNNLVRLAQLESFSKDIAAVAKNGQVDSHSDLRTLAPILINGILRLRGRLRHAAISKDSKHPIILPARHPLTTSIVTYYHLKNLHAGPQLLVACVREKFWPLRIRNLARSVVHSCVNCFRCRPRTLDQIMGDLPSERVTPTLPFLNTGVDLCGPFQYRKASRAPPIKCYVAIFVCLVTKAVHVELVYDLSTQAFIAALHRFVARRGKPNLIECDNAKNFKGAVRELKQLAKQFRSQQHQSEIVNRCADDGITIKFIPPRSPNFGGLWEAAVKSFKQHFRRTVGNSILSLDEFVTLLARIEACLNSRPLTPLTADVNDLEVLTPGHFLVHRPLTCFPEPNLSDVPQNRLDRWQRNQELLRRLWKRWTIDYLSGIHPRTKWTRIRDNVAIGTMVLLKDDNLPPLKWRYGRVSKIYHGDDGNIRVVDVRTAEEEYQRGITKICVLPIQQTAGPTEVPGLCSDDH